MSDSYADLIASDEVDAVYVATLASLHREWTIAAIEAGKHVLCEKPLAANAQDAALIANAAAGSDVVVMEAFHWRYHPIVAQVESILDAGILGEIQSIDARFTVHSSAIPPTDIRYDLSLGGGAMMDIGCYPASWVRWAIEGEPSVEGAEANCPVPDVDGSLRAELSWPSDVTGTIFGSMISETPGQNASLEIVGSKATMFVDNPLAPQTGASLQIRSDTGVADIPVLPGSTYESQLIASRDAVAFGGPFPTTATDGVATMALIDACYIAAGLDPRPTRVRRAGPES